MAEAGFEYDVAVSFAGEDREIAQRFAALLENEGLRVFYDIWKQADLWGRDLYQHLDDVYSSKSRFCVIFLSAHYAAKAWTNHELKSAQARAFRENDEYILPVRIDDTDIPGIRPTLGYVSLRSMSVEKVAELAIQKVKVSPRKSTSASPEAGPAKPGDVAPFSASQPIRSSNVKLKKEFTDHDRDEFLEKAFEYIANFFEGSLAELQAQNPGITGKFRRIDGDRFTAIVYRDGKQASACGIRREGTGRLFSRSIAYSDDPGSTNSFNESLSAADDGDQMFLKALGTSMTMSGRPKAPLTMNDAAEILWGLFVGPLHRRSASWH